MTTFAAIDELTGLSSISHEAEARPRRRARAWLMKAARGLASGLEWLFGFVSLGLGLAMLASLPIVQFATLGYLLESSGRVARTGRLRDGVFGVRKAARVGGAVAGAWISLAPLWLFQSFARSAAIIDPGGPVARGWRIALIAASVVVGLHLAAAFARGGQLRHFLWPLGNPVWLARRLRRGGLYAEARDGLWEFAASLRPIYYFRLGLVGFLGTLAWLAVPSALIGLGLRVPLLAVLGVPLLGFVCTFLPFLQVRYAVEGRARAFASPRDARRRFLRAPWAFAFALLVLLVGAIPLYLLKIEMVPREAAWLPGLVFVLFLAPARLLTGWAYHRSERRDRPRHWTFRWVGRLAIVPVAVLYVLVVYFSQFTSWAGAGGLLEQHAFLLPAPFLGS